MTPVSTPVYRVRARCAEPLACDWRDHLAARLGAKPRRLGRWAELGLYGALQCLAPQTTLDSACTLVASSQRGPTGAMQDVKLQAQEGLPLPLTFLQIQPSQLLATLSAQLQWCGDARFFTHPEPFAVLALTLAMTNTRTRGALVGWVDESPVERSLWLHLEPIHDMTDLPRGDWRPALALRHLGLESVVHTVDYLRQDPTGLAVIIKG